ncbi:DUF928 domain-containing protein [Fischerella thermalis]|uniref:DUF928 domain-containing protein n=1 Tax=Fischerella thermalis TaxID=372787 RepID=UPI0011AEF582|nr:DUF928 domain-containing protein [Fischerella thermalis]
MNNKLMLSALVSATAFSFLPPTVHPATHAQTTQRKQTSFWERIAQIILRQPEPPIKPSKGGSRPIEMLCMVSPDAPKETRIVWSDRPLFIWQGNVKEIALLQQGNEQELWRQNVLNTKHTTYTGTPLQPGQTYKWLVYPNTSSPRSPTFVSFQVMEAPKRNQITNELTKLEAQLKAKGAAEETIAEEKAKFFADKELWSDFMQQVYSVKNPSPELLKLIEDIPKQLCSGTSSSRGNASTRHERSTPSTQPRKFQTPDFLKKSGISQSIKN